MNNGGPFAAPSPNALAFLDAKGVMARRCREYDWASNSIGPPETWDHGLQTMVGMMLRTSFPGFISWGPKRIYLYNDAYSVVLGPVKNKTALGQPFYDVWSEIWPELEPLVLEVDRGESRYFENLRFVLNRSGQLEETFHTFSYSPLIMNTGEVGGLFCSCVETTKQVRATQELEKTEAELVGVLESMNEAFFSVDKDFVITRVNSNHERATLIPKSKQVGQNFLDLFLTNKEDRDSQYRQAYHRAMADRTHVSFEDYYKPLDLWTAVNIYPQADGGLAIFFRRINEEKQAQAEILKAKEDAERANHLKSAFLANMSHEIRTPLGAMIGFADLLKDRGISASERSNYIDILHKNGEQLGRVINDILDLSKVETGHINFEYLEVDPRQVAQEVVSLLTVVAKSKGLVLTLDIDQATPQVLISDPTRMKQVLMNLVGNALKFTKVGTIKIHLTGRTGGGEKTSCAFSVTDTGIGIPDESVERLFKMFSQADNSMTRKFGGTGLGLALSRSLARAMGGDVHLESSTVDVGSVFRFSIESQDDRRQLNAGTGSEPSDPSSDVVITDDFLKGVRVLLVEDSPDNQELIWRCLTKYGSRVQIADNGIEGIEKALASEHDVVLMDLQMPFMDGYTATGKLRAKGYSTPIIALTAHAMVDVRKKCRDVGCNDHLPKPINPVDLVRAVAHHARPAKKRAT